jgi:oxygen-dependent protoporphyrinogen oxidase
MQETIETDVVILGAGLTGLTAAFYAKKKGLKVVLIEKNNRVGGVIHTIRDEDFVFETGPNTGVLSHPEVVELFEDLASYCKLETANAEAKKRLIWKAGQWHALPDGLIKAIKTPLFSAKDKLGILGEPFRKKGTNPFESVADLVKRRLGHSYLDYAVDPFISGVYAGDPSQLVTKYALPKLYALEQKYGSFIKGGLKKGFEKKDERMKKATREVFSAEGGLEMLVKSIEANLDGRNIFLNSGNTRVEKVKDKYEVTTSSANISYTFSSKYVISTTDAETLPALFPFLQPNEFEPITNLKYAKVTQVILGFKNWNGIPLDAFGGLVPSKEKRNILGVLFISSFLKNRAPRNGALLSVFIGGIKKPELFNLSDIEIKELVSNELKEMMQLKSVEPEIMHIFRYPKAIPQYERSSKERIEAIEKIQEKFPGLILAGGIRDGIGMADRIKQAHTIIQQLS